MTQKQCVLFLEPRGTALEVIREAKNAGYRVVALSSDASLISGAPLPYRTAEASIDDLVEVGSWEDEFGLRALVDEVNRISPIVGIYYAGDPCALIAAKLRERLKLPTTPSAAIDTILNKYKLRKTLKRAGLSRLHNYHQVEMEALQEWPLHRPYYFKPVRGSFSAYVERCENREQYESAVAKWKMGNDADPVFVRNFLDSKREYHVEEAIDGELMSVEAISQGGNFHVIGLTSRILYSKNAVVEMGSVFPYPHPLLVQIIEKVKAAHQVLGFSEGASHTELIVSPSGEIEIIDFNPRFVGADVMQSINNAFGIKIQSALLDQCLGRPVQLDLKQVGFSCLQYVLSPPVAVFESIEFPRDPEVRFATSFLKPGTQLKSTERQMDYLGCYLTFMPTFETALARSGELRAKVKVNGTFPGVY